MHLKGGVELLHSIPRTILSENNTSNTIILSGSRMLLAHVVGQIRRLDMQAVAYLVRWTLAGIQ
jgi:hypothetical protein